MLSQDVDPLRLRMEFLNHTRHPEKYAGDPLAPALYQPDYLFATTMFSNPPGWFETSGLPEESMQSTSALVKIWKQERAAMFSGTILPIGETPDGTSWSGFASAARDAKSGHILLFRETNDRSEFSLKLPDAMQDIPNITLLAGEGTLERQGDHLHATIPSPKRCRFARIDGL